MSNERNDLRLVEKATESYLAQGVQQRPGFSGGVRSTDYLGLEVGDQWTFPEEYNVLGQKMGVNRNGDDIIAEFILVQMTNGTVKPFYPSTFTKRRRVYDKNNQPTAEYAVTDGDAAEEYRKVGGTVAGAMAAMAGKTVKVSKIREVNTKAWGQDSYGSVQIPTIEFVE